MIRAWLRRRRDEALWSAYRAVAEIGPAGGYDIGRRARLRPARLYPALARLEGKGWIVSGPETPPPVDRRPRRFYRLSDDRQVSQ